MRLLALIGSPRRQGNTGLLVQRVIEGAQLAGLECETIWLDWRKVNPIQYCKPCLQRRACLQEDDFEEIMSKFIAADYVILGTPLYWYGPSAQLKAFIERWSCKLYMSTRLTGSQEHFRSQVRGKKILAVSAHEEPGPYVVDHLWGMLQWTCDYLQMELIAKVHGEGNRSGEVGKDVQAVERAFAVGRSLGTQA